MMERILREAMKKAQAAEVTRSRSESTPVSFQNDKLKAIKVSQSAGVTLRVIVDARLGSSHTSDMEDLDGLVERAVEAARFGSDAHFSFPSPQKAPEVKTYDASVPEISRERMVEIGREMLDLVKEYDTEVLVSCGASRSFGEREYINSSGHAFRTEGTHFSVHVGGERIRGTDILQAGEGRGWRTPGLDHVDLARRVIEKFRLAERIAEVNSGELPVIFTSGAAIVVLLSLGIGLNGRNVLKGDSPLAGKLDQQIVDTGLTITDNPLIDYAPSSGGYDGEGVPHRITPLIEKGVLKSFLYDLDTAGRAGTKSTGNGPGCQPSNVLVGSGDTSYEEMIASVDEGLLIDGVMGLGQSNIINGDFSVNVSLGYKIERGEIVGRVKDVMIAGNAYDALKRIAAIGDTPEWVSGWGSMKAPPIGIERLSVVSK